MWKKVLKIRNIENFIFNYTDFKRDYTDYKRKKIQRRLLKVLNYNYTSNLISEKNGIKTVEFLNPASNPWESGFKFIVTARLGGMSSHPFNSLNLSYRAGDNKENVDSNRKKLLRLLNCSEKNLFHSGQIHSDSIAQIKEDSKTYIPGADALISNKKDIFLSILVADCLPVMIFDPSKKALGIAHCGWKGTLLFLVKKTLNKMVEVFSANPLECKAILGPSICPNCYEIKDDVVDKVKDAFKGEERGIIRKNGKIYFDLTGLNAELLEEAGLKKENIYFSNLCTYERDDLFFSHRRDNGKTGRMMVVGWRETNSKP